MVRQRLISNLSEVLEGEVDPESIEVSVGDDETMASAANDGVLFIQIRYRLATINREENIRVPLQGGSLG